MELGVGAYYGKPAGGVRQHPRGQVDADRRPPERTDGRGVRCVSVSPGPTVTPILADFEASMGADRIRASAELVGGHARPEDVAAIIAFLAGPAARWINGIDVRADGGLLGARMAPVLASA